MDINLYYNAKDKLYYFVNIDKECDNCKRLLRELVIIRVFWDKLGSGVNYMCYMCRDKVKSSNKATITNTFLAMIIDEIPRGCDMVLITKPILSEVDNTTIFDVDSIKCKTIDKTRYSNRERRVKEYVIDDGKDCKDLIDIDKFLLEQKNNILIGFDDNEVKLLK